MTYVSINSVTRTFKTRKKTKTIHALGPLDLTVFPGEFIAIIGPSGCGKSTLLRLIAGLDQPTDGIINVDNIVVTKPTPKCGMVFQQFALFPWLTIHNNVGFGLKGNIGTKDKPHLTIEHWLEAVGLSEFANAYPNALSGGMQQRAALARALAPSPKILLLDEPFGSLDQQTRAIMQELIEGLWNKEKRTIILVTHDIEEALFLADRIIIMSARPGQIIKEISLNFNRPRQNTLRTNKRFTNLKSDISKILRHQVLYQWEGKSSKL